MATDPTATAADRPAVSAAGDAELEAALALIAQRAAAKPLPQAMAELCAHPDFKAGLAVMAAAFALYPAEPSNDLNYGIMSMNRLVARYGQTSAAA